MKPESNAGTRSGWLKTLHFSWSYTFIARTKMPNKSSESSQPEELTRVSAEDMRNKPLSEDQKAVLKTMAAKQAAGDDSDVDYSDIPALTDEQLARAIPGRFLFGKDPRFPVFLDPEIFDSMTKIAARNGTTLNNLVNDVLKRELALVEVLR